MGKTKAVNLRNSLAKVASINNAQFWDMARRFSPDFKSHTAEKTLEEFNEKGFESFQLSGTTDVLNEFFEISMRVAFQLMNVARAKNPFIDKGLVQVYDTPNGGFVQRMAVHSIKPTSPRFLGLKDGDSPDPWTVRRPSIESRFFSQNFQYQSFITLQEHQIKTMFISPYGMGELVSGVMQALENGYTIQEYLNVKECFNVAINSQNHPLQDTQNLTLDSWTDGAPTSAELTDFILALKDTASRLELTPITGMYNAMKFESRVDTADMVLVMRAGIKNRINTGLMVGAFNPEYLTLPFENIETPDFGGIEHYADSSFSTPVYPVYNDLGERTGWNTADDGTGTAVSDDEVYKKDPNEDVLAVLMQRGMIFENAQNPYTVRPIMNPAGLYTNYWASRPNNGINVDALYNMIVFRKPSGNDVPSGSIVPVGG